MYIYIGMAVCMHCSLWFLWMYIQMNVKKKQMMNEDV